MLSHHPSAARKVCFLWARLCAVFIFSSLSLATVGQFKAVNPITGPLQVHPENPRYFADGSGKAILLAGSHFWANIMDMSPSDPPEPFDFDAHLAWLARYGHNFTRGWVWEPTRWDTSTMRDVWANVDLNVAPHPWVRSGPGLAQDGKPKFDLERHNPEFFERLKDRVAKAKEHGIYISIMLFEGFGVQFRPEAWPNHPFNIANNINAIDGDLDDDDNELLFPIKPERRVEVHTFTNSEITRIQEAYVRKVLETLNDFDNVLYEISNETHPSSTDWQYHMIRFIKRHQCQMPKQHPVGMTYQNRGGRNETLFDSPADWVSPNPEGGFRDDPPDMKGQKVVISDTDHLWGIGGDEVWAWKTVTRGLHPIFMDPYDGSVLVGRETPEYEAVREAMGHALAYSRRMNLAKAVPHKELSSTTYCLADPGTTYLVFAPEGGHIDIDLTAFSGPFAVEWHDPAVGRSQTAQAVEGGVRQTFRAPFDGAAVLFLLKQNVQ